MDGCGDLRFLWSVVLPLSKPLIAVIALMYAIGQWNSYFDALIYLKSPDLYPLQLVLRNILILNTQTGGCHGCGRPDGTSAAGQPAQVFADRRSPASRYCIIYPFVARHFNKGVLIGSIKG